VARPAYVQAFAPIREHPSHVQNLRFATRFAAASSR
jgi:hypothetical protein